MEQALLLPLTVPLINLSMLIRGYLNHSVNFPVRKAELALQAFKLIVLAK